MNFDHSKDYHDQINRSWEHLKPYRNNRILMGTTWLLFAVPLIVKNRDRIPFDMDLPFSWKVLWVAALLFTLANLIFSFKCPRIIKDFESFPEFEKTQRGLTRLNQLFIDAGLKHGGIDLNKSKLNTTIDTLGQELLGGRVLEGNPLMQEMVGNAPLTNLSFNWVYAIANRTGYKSRWFVYLSYNIGLLLAGWVAIENIWHVIVFMAT